MINQLDNTTIRALLIDLTTRGSPSAQAAVQHAYQKLARVPPIDFNQKSKEVWKVLNSSRYTKMSSRKQYDASGEASNEIEHCIQQISDQTKANSPLETKQSALKTIAKIMETILYAEPTTLAKEVRKGVWETSTPDVMKHILESMTAKQRISVGKLVVDTEGSSAEEGPLVHKIWSVWDDAGLACQKGLTGVLELMGEDETSNPFQE